MQTYTIEAKLTAAHRDELRVMLESTPSFLAEEVDVALELLDEALDKGKASDYRFLFARDSGMLVGYICFGPTPMTEGTYDLYWLATHPAATRRGIARALVQRMEEILASEGGRVVRVETSSQEGYGAARKFYLAAGYSDAACLPDFYRPGDDLVIYTKRLDRQASEPRAVRWDFESLFDLAFAYRDFDAEREFLRGCARRWGGREPVRVLEWACGPSRHLESFAKLPRVEAIGVDASPAMLDLARRRLAQYGRVRLVEGSMTQAVDIPPVDLAFNMLSTIHHLTSNEEIVTHLGHCAAALAPGGIYVIEATHPRDLTRAGANDTRWRQQEGHVAVDGWFCLHVDQRLGDRVPSTLELSCQADHDRRVYRLEMPWLVLDEAQWRAVIDESEVFDLVAMYGDLDTTVPVSAPTAWRLVLVLRRRS